MIESETLASIENPLYATFFDIFEKVAKFMLCSTPSLTSFRAGTP
jgi:hypothetical protein